MMFEREQLIRAQRASLDALCEDTNLLFAAIGDLIALGMSAKKSALKDSAAETAALLDARDAKDLLTVARDVRHPRLGKAVTYGCVFYDLMAQTQARAWRLAEIRANGVKESLWRHEPRQGTRKHRARVRHWKRRNP